MLAEWGDRAAGVLMLLPLWHPVAAAEQLGTLASIARGPFVLQCALGGGEQQFAAMGVSQRHRARASSRGSTSSGGCSTARRSPRRRPVPGRGRAGRAGPARAARGLDRRGRTARRSTAPRAWVTGGSPTPTSSRARPRSRPPPTASVRGARPRRRASIAIRRDVHVGADHDDAERVAGPIVAAGYRGFRPDAITYGSRRRGDRAASGPTRTWATPTSSCGTSPTTTMRCWPRWSDSARCATRSATPDGVSLFSTRPDPDPVGPGPGVGLGLPASAAPRADDASAARRARRRGDRGHDAARTACSRRATRPTTTSRPTTSRPVRSSAREGRVVLRVEGTGALLHVRGGDADRSARPRGGTTSRAPRSSRSAGTSRSTRRAWTRASSTTSW